MKNNIIYSGFFRRFLALLIDIIIVVVTTMLAFGIYEMELVSNIRWINGGALISYSVTNGIYIAYAIAAWIVYAFVLELLLGATLGSLIVGQKVCDFMKNRPAILRLLMKHVLKPIDIIFGPAFFLFSKTNQSIGDAVSGIVVVKRKSMDLPLVELPVHWFRKVVGSVLLLGIILITIAGAYFIPKMVAQQNFVTTTLKDAQMGFADLNAEPFFNAFSEYFKQNATLAAFVQSMNESKLHLMLQDVNVDNTRVTHWYFKGNNHTELALTDGKWLMAIITTKDPNDRIALEKIDIQLIQK